MDWLNGWRTLHGFTLHAKGKAQRGGERKGTDRWTTQFKDIGIFPQENSDQILFFKQSYMCVYVCARMLVVPSCFLS